MLLKVKPSTIKLGGGVGSAPVELTHFQLNTGSLITFKAWLLALDTPKPKARKASKLPAILEEELSLDD